MKKQISRRSFLALSAAAVAGGLSSRVTPAYADEAATTAATTSAATDGIPFDELTDSSTYEDYVEFGKKYLSDMPNPEHMSSEGDASAYSLMRSRGPYWSADGSGPKTFYQGDGSVFLDRAIRVVDVSEHNGDIDWNAVKNSGVDAAILRIGYGSWTEDKQFRANYRGCQNVGLPFGVYIYSYAYDGTFARHEGEAVAKLMDQCGFPKDMPVFYDLEEWEWTGYKPPTDTGTYEAMAWAFFNALEKRGYTNHNVYSGLHYLNGPLNSKYIHDRATWVAQYKSSTFGYSFPPSIAANTRAWQYTESGYVNGIGADVDLNAFSLFPYFSKHMGALYGFSDVFASTDHHEDIGWLKDKGIAAGFPDGSFRGLSSVARQDMAAFIYRLAGSPSYTPSAEDKKRFKDFSNPNDTESHAKEVMWLGSKGVAEGFKDGAFRGLSHIARQDMAAFLYRLAGSPSYTPSAEDKKRFKDFQNPADTEVHAKEVMWLGASGIAQGFSDGTFRGTQEVARQDMAAFLHRFASKYKVSV